MKVTDEGTLNTSDGGILNTADEGTFGFGLRPRKERARPVKTRHLLTLKELNREELTSLLALAAEVKQRPYQFNRSMAGKTLAMIFAKPSTRTRVSFEAGMNQLGGSAIFLSSTDLQLGRGETIADTARVLSRFVDGIMVRTFAQADVEEMAEAATVPVINGLTDDWHPCQVIADLLTMAESLTGEVFKRKTAAQSAYSKAFEGVKLAYVGDGNNMTNTLIIGCAIAGIEIAVASPNGYEVAPAIADEVRSVYGAKVTLTNDPAEAVAGADFIYTDVWASMGQEDEHAARVEAFSGYQVNAHLVAASGKPDTKVLHCLPAHRGEEISAEIIDDENTIIWDQAENRLHAQKALMLSLMIEGAIDGG